MQFILIISNIIKPKVVPHNEARLGLIQQNYQIIAKSILIRFV